MWHDLILDVDLICTNEIYNLTIPMLVQSIIYAYVVPKRLAQMIVYCLVTHVVALTGFYWGRGATYSQNVICIYYPLFDYTDIFSYIYKDTSMGNIWGGAVAPLDGTTCHMPCKKVFWAR